MQGDLNYMCIKLYFSFNIMYIFPVITDKHFSVRWIGRGGTTNPPLEVPILWRWLKKKRAVLDKELN